MARVIITGCSTGIGRATATLLAERGYEVVATARRPETLADLDVKERLALDVMSDESVARAVEAAGSVDILVNNAGIGLGGPVESVPLDAARRMFETNFWGAVRMIQAVAPEMRERGRGTIVNVSSVAGRAVGPLNGFYSATKFALEAISKALYAELGHFGVRTIVIEPGYIDTPILAKEKEEVYGVDGPPYDELERQWEAASQVLQGDGPAPADLVATRIVDAIESDDPALQHPVGADAELIVGMLSTMSFEEFFGAAREMLGVDW